MGVVWGVADGNYRQKIRVIMAEVLFLKRVLNDYTALNRESITANFIGCLV